jgi:hypothetical protein
MAGKEKGKGGRGLFVAGLIIFAVNLLIVVLLGLIPIGGTPIISLGYPGAPTGGGAAMRGLEQLLQREFGVPVRIGRPEYVDGLTDEDKPWSFAAVAGALMFAHSHYERKSLFDGFFKGLFK